MELGGKFWIRWPVGILAVLIAFKNALGIGLGDRILSVGSLWLAVVLLFVAALCFFPELVRAAASPLTRWIDSLYLPGGRPEPPPLSYRLARYYQLTCQYHLAVDEYARILDAYPQEAEAYAGMVNLLANELYDRRGARRWLKRGLRRLADREAQGALRDEFGFLLEPEDHRISA